MPYTPISSSSSGTKTVKPKTPIQTPGTPQYTEKQLLQLAARLKAFSDNPYKTTTKNGVTTRGTGQDVTDKVQAAFRGIPAKDVQRIGQQAGLDPQTIGTLQWHAGNSGASGPGLAATALNKVLDIANRPSQAVLGGITEGGSGALKGLTGEKSYTPVRAFVQGIQGKSEKQATQAEKNLGFWATPINIAASIPTDPISYLSFGTSAFGKEAAYHAADLAAEKGLVGVTAENVLKQGAGAFGKGELKQIGKDIGGKEGRRLVRAVRGAPGGVKVAGRTVVNTKGITDRLAETYAKSPVARVLDPFEAQFRNRAGIIQAARRGELGYAGVARGLETGAARLEGELGQAKQQLAAQVQHALRIGEVGPRSDALARIRDSLDVGGAGVQLSEKEAAAHAELRNIYDSMLGEARQRGVQISSLGTGRVAAIENAANKAVDNPVLAKIRRIPQPTPELLNRAAAEEQALSRQYTAHVLTPQGRELFDKNPKLFEQSGFAPGGYAKHRVVEGSIAEKNARLAPEMQKYGLTGPAYEPDLTKAVVTRGTAQARDLAKRDYLQNLPGIKAADGTPVSFSEKEWRQAGKPRNMVEVKIPGDMGADPIPMYFHKEVAPEVQRVMGILQHRGSDNPFVQAIDAANQQWKRLAVGSPGFASRNLLQGNLFNGMFLGDLGTRMTLTDIKRATEMQIALKRGLAAGDPFKFLDAVDKEALDAAQRSGALGTGFLTSGADVTIKKSVKGRLRDETLGGATKRVLSRANPLHAIRDTNTAFENNSRLALFLHNYKTLGEDGAAKIVRTRLFDYNDLTPFEQQTMKRISPFYTWSRKNIPLQLENLAKHPSRLSRIQQIKSELARQSGPIENGPVPSYLGDSVKLPFSGGEAVWKPDFPINQASDQLTPLIDIAGAAVHRNPSEAIPALGKIISQNTGGVSGLSVGAIEAALGKNLFTGATYKPGARVDSVFGKIDPAVLNILEKTLPPLQRIKMFSPQTEADKKAQTRRLISFFGGFNIYPLNDSTKNQALHERLDKLTALQQTLQDTTGQKITPLKDTPGYTRPKTASKSKGGYTPMSK